jgi:hypothetical protein
MEQVIRVVGKSTVATAVQDMPEEEQHCRKTEMAFANRLIDSLFNELLLSKHDLSFTEKNVDKVADALFDSDVLTPENINRFFVAHLFEKARIAGIDKIERKIAKQKANPDILFGEKSTPVIIVAEKPPASVVHTTEVEETMKDLFKKLLESQVEAHVVQDTD